MATNHPRGASIAVLPEIVSKRIAAGEVIERPASIARELIDNAIDADAATINVTYAGGGIERIRVVDNGSGMGRDDLALCWLPHATSKIHTLEDLAHSTSMGFRGEALPSVAAVAEMEIRSRLHGTADGYRIRLVDGAPPTVESAACAEGTQVEVRRLFANIPARRRFLSRPAAEAAMIRQTVLDKALANEQIHFALSSESGRRLLLPPGTLINRVSRVFGDSVPESSIHLLQATGDGFAINIAAATPDIARRDRRLIQTCVNRRRVWEYRLTHAVEHAYGEVLHGGLFPAVAVFVAISPELVDVNVHPAKREVRIRSIGEIHHRITETLQHFLRAYTIRTVSVERDLFPSGVREATADWTDRISSAPSESSTRPLPTNTPGNRLGTAGGSPVSPNSPASRAKSTQPIGRLRFVGHLFDTFLVVQDDERVYVIDQHAAHERILYDRFRDERTSQKLLIEEEFETTADDDVALKRHQGEFRDLGIELERVSSSRWKLVSAPNAYRENADDTIDTIRELGAIQGHWDREFVARMACKAAVKAGATIDAGTSLELAKTTLGLPVPRCPHGRPLWVELDRTALLRLIGRLT